MTIEEKTKESIRDVKDFPKPGILFKDVTPIFQSPELSNEIVEYLTGVYKNRGVDAIVGIESRGFFFGFPLAMKMGIPFVPIRKKGKLPYDTISYAYDLEYGRAEVEIHADALKPGMKVLVHDDLLATGGTALAAAELVTKLGAEVVGYDFIVELEFLGGRERLGVEDDHMSVLAAYS